LAVLAGLVIAFSTTAYTTAVAEDTPSSKAPAVLQFKMKSLAGKETDLANFKGQVLLVVNVASHCGYTDQYEGLQNLYTKFQGKGLTVLGVPCNQFGKQEPGSEEDIAQFCKKNYGVTFPMFAKVDVNGAGKCELYNYLTSKETNPASPGPIRWNFEKFLIGRDGQILARFPSSTEPNDEALLSAIERALGK